jgi:hypothetical protein
VIIWRDASIVSVAMQANSATWVLGRNSTN